MMGTRGRRGIFIFPIVAMIVILSLATLLLTIGARSPYTHSNLGAEPYPRYARSEQAFVGQEIPYDGGGMTALSQDTVTEALGKVLLVTRGCASCHGVDGRGGTIGPPIVGFDLEDLQRKSKKGPGGMPVFSEALSDDDLAAIAAFLKK